MIACSAASSVAFAQAPTVEAYPVPAPPVPAPSLAQDVQPGEQVFQVLGSFSKVGLMHLDTRVIELRTRIKVVDGFDPAKLTVTALSEHRIRVRGENPGVTSVKLLDESGRIYTLEVFVEPDTRELQAYLQRLFPGAAIEVIGLRADEVVLKGWVTEPTQIPQIMSIAEAFYPTVHSQLVVGGVSQVQLHVKVIEVQRTKLREMGFNFLMVGEQYFVSNAIGGLAPLQSVTLPFGGPPNATILPSALSSNEFNFGVAGNSDIFQGFLKLMQSEALAKILAEPVLVTTSGRPATLHSGGEFPILVPQSFGNLSIEWREFGVQMEAVPVVLGNGRVRLDLSPEVSERDFSNSVSINGLVVPGITSRRVNTQVELSFGETLMIGGLISTRRLGTTQKVPFLGELPWVGAAFRRTQYSTGETELVILVTPHMAAPMAPHQVPCGGPGLQSDSPTDRELYIDGTIEVPRIGPECPGPACQTLPTQLIAPPPGGVLPPNSVLPPGSVPAPPAPGLVPPPVGGASEGPLLIQQTSGEQPDKVKAVNPFKRNSAATANAPMSASVPDTRESSRGPRSETLDLPGLIPPQAGNASSQDAAARR